MKVDGKESEFYPVGDALIGVELTEGEHTIEMDYTPKGLWMGTFLSLLCVALYLAARAITQRKEKEKQEELTEEESADISEGVQEYRTEEQDFAEENKGDEEDDEL